jgi:hypothetical protein
VLVHLDTAFILPVPLFLKESAYHTNGYRLFLITFFITSILSGVKARHRPIGAN